MSLTPIPNLPFAADTTSWEPYGERFDALLAQELTPETINQWLQDWSDLDDVIDEVGNVTYIETSLDTKNEAAEQAFLDFLEHIEPRYREVDQLMKERLLAYVAEGHELDSSMAVPLRNMQNEADLFRAENIPLMTQLSKLGNEYDKLTGGLKADWDGEEKNLSQLNSLLLDRDRNVRQRAWETMMGLWSSIRPELNALYSQMLDLRRQIAANAGLKDFRDYSYRSKNRFDYTPEDSLAFHDAIEAVVVPASQRIYERQRRALEIETVRPWDVEVDANDAPALKPYEGQAELVQGSLDIFQQVDPYLARQFAAMAEAGLLDLDTRQGKALGGYCAGLSVRKMPFIFMNGDGTHDDVQTMLHEAGHAFHSFERYGNVDLKWQRDVPMEFAEVASMAMELLAAPYLTSDAGGFYTTAEAARARQQHLEGILRFLPYMAVVDAFQHWVYTHPDEAADPANCDATWTALWDRFMKGIDWSGYEAERESGWHRKLHIFHVPFYYVEYGMAQVGALQVWRNALDDQAAAVAAYREALALGGTVTLPELFATAGASFRFEESMLQELVQLIESTLSELSKLAAHEQTA